MARLAVRDFLDLRAEVTESGGEAEAQFRCPVDEYWLVDRAVVSTSSAGASTLRVFIGGERPTDVDLIDASTAGNLDVADNASPWRVLPGQVLTFRWSGLTAGAVCRVHAQGRILRREG